MNRGNWCSAVLLFSHLFLPIISTLAFRSSTKGMRKGTPSVYDCLSKMRAYKKPYIKMIPNGWLPSTNTIYLIIYNGMQEMPVSFLFNGPFTSRSQKAPQRCCNNCDSNHQNSFLESQSRRDSGCPTQLPFGSHGNQGQFGSLPSRCRCDCPKWSFQDADLATTPGCWPAWCPTPNQLLIWSHPVIGCYWSLYGIESKGHELLLAIKRAPPAHFV